MDQPKRILVVDDEEQIRGVLRKFLGSMGYEVETAQDGIEALSKLDLDIDLVLLDIKMPGMDGFETARRIRESPEHQDLPVIMVTELTSREDRLRAVEVGADDFIAKPLDFTEIRIRIASLLRKKEVQNELKRRREELEETVKERTAALQESEKKYRELFEQSRDAIYMTTRDGKIVETNQANIELLGYSRDELIGLDVMNIYYNPTDRKKFQTQIERKGFVADYELKLKKKDGAVIDCIVTATLRRDKDGTILGYQGIIRDITEHKQAEEEILIANERLHYLLASSGAVIYTAKNSGDYGTTFISDNVMQMVGYSPGEFLEKSDFWINNVHPEDVPRIDVEVSQIFERDYHRYEYRFLRKDGEYIWVSDEMKLVRDGKGNPIEIVGFWADITERKQAEEELALHAKILEKINDSVFVHDIEGNIVFVNEKTCESYGCSKNELIGINIRTLASTEESKNVEPRQQELREKGALTFEAMRLRKDGSLMPIEVNALVVKLGVRELVISVSRDITERKQAEEAFRRSEEKYRTLAESTTDVIFMHDRDGRYLYVNQACAEFLSQQPDRIIGSTLADFFPEEDTRDMAKYIESVFEEESAVHFEHSIPVAGGSRHFSGTLSPIYDSERNIVSVVGVSRDITERKQIEDERRISHHLLEIVNRHTEIIPMLNDFIEEIKNFTGCNSVGIRLRDEEGNIPYSAYKGFSHRFYEFESPLSIKSDQCMCINIVKGEIDPNLPFYTAGGSFYINGTTRFLNTVSEEDKGKTRNMCNEFGYESVALVPIFVEETIIGLIHIADPQENMVPLRVVKMLEGAAMQLGTAIQRILSEEELRSSRQQLRDLTAHIQTAREEERTAMAREIHDELGQTLSALKIDISGLEKRFSSDQKPLFEITDSMKKVISSTADVVDRISSELRPGLLDDLGLLAAMDWQVGEFQKRTGIKCEISLKIAKEKLDQELSTAVFRIFQETLTNIARHSRAASVKVKFEEKDDKLYLKVKDNGVGITEQQKSDSKSYGLIGMRERTRYLGGDFKISGRKNKGTTVIATFPLSKPGETS